MHIIKTNNLQNVCPRVRLFRLHSANFNPIWLGKIPKDAEFSEVVHSTFRYRNFLLIFRKSAEYRFPGKFRTFKFCVLTPFMIVSGVKRSLILNLQFSRHSELPDGRNLPNINGEIQEEIFFLHFCKFGCDKGFGGCLFRILRFPLDPDYDFQEKRENTEFTGKFRKKFFFSFW